MCLTLELILDAIGGFAAGVFHLLAALVGVHRQGDAAHAQQQHALRPAGMLLARFGEPAQNGIVELAALGGELSAIPMQGSEGGEHDRVDGQLDDLRLGANLAQKRFLVWVASRSEGHKRRHQLETKKSDAFVIQVLNFEILKAGEGGLAAVGRGAAGGYQLGLRVGGVQVLQEMGELLAGAAGDFIEAIDEQKTALAELFAEEGAIEFPFVALGPGGEVADYPGGRGGIGDGALRRRTFADVLFEAGGGDQDGEGRGGAGKHLRRGVGIAAEQGFAGGEGDAL